MKDLDSIENWKPKKLRTLRMNLNNRLQTFKSKGPGAPELQKSNKLYGLKEEECKELLVKVQKLLSIKKD
ncbi:MAG: hypothetical protein ACHQYQ_04420 [Bacteriovoracales bacterium]